MTTHNIKTYKDGFKSVEFCANCGQEEGEFTVACVPLSPVGKMEDAYKKFKDAIDKDDQRN